MRKKTIALTAASLLLVSGAAFTMRPGEDGLARVERGDVVHLLVSPAVVEASSERISLGFEVSGTIAEVFVKEGDRVEADQVLARLDDRLARSRVARAEAALEAAKARRDASVKGSRKAEIDAAEAEAAAARSTAWERAQTHARIQKLSASNAVSAQQVDDAQSAADAARANSDAAEARLALAKEGSRTEVRREAEAAALAAAADLEEAKTLLSKHEVRAPITGVILRRLAEPGELVTVTPPEVVFAMANLDRLQLRVEIDEADVGRVSSGQRGFAIADAYGNKRFAGQITTITKELGRKTLRTDDPRAKADTRVLEVMFALDESTELPLGLRMDVHVETVARRDVLTVPVSAIAASEGASEVTVLKDGERVKQKVQLGAEDGVKAEILAGLREGDLIALDVR